MKLNRPATRGTTFPGEQFPGTSRFTVLAKIRDAMDGTGITTVERTRWENLAP